MMAGPTPRTLLENNGLGANAPRPLFSNRVHWCYYYWDNIGREPLGSRRDIVIVVEEYFLKKGFTEHYIVQTFELTN